MRRCLFLSVALIAFTTSCERKPQAKFLKYHANIEKMEGPEEEKELIRHFPKALYRIHEVNGVGKFYIDSRADLVKNRLRSGQPWKPEIAEVLKSHAKAGTTVIDIGAHMGTHTVTLSDGVGDRGRVIAFEPDLKLYSELVENLELNEKKNVTAFRAGLGQDYKSEDKTLPPAQIIPLDSLGLNNVSLIKLDVPGQEEEILSGAQETLDKNRPYIVLEISGLKPGEKGRRRERVERVVRQLQNKGYDLFMLNNNYNLWLAEPL